MRRRRKNPTGGDAVGVALGLAIPVVVVAARRVSDGRELVSGRDPDDDGTLKHLGSGIAQRLDVGVAGVLSALVAVGAGVGVMANGWRPGPLRGVLVGASVAALGAASVKAFLSAPAPPMTSPKAEGPTNVGPFPLLRVGTIVLVDTRAANIPPPFNASPEFPFEVDQVLSDPLVVSVRAGVRGVGPFFSGTIQRSAIIRILSLPAPGATA